MPTITLTVDAANAQRIITALGRYRALTDAGGARRDATLAEVKQELATYLRTIVRDTELQQAATTTAATFVDPALT